MPDDFVFAVKGGRFITHMKKLDWTSRRRWRTSSPPACSPSSRKLGPLLWQLPPNLGFDAERMEAFFDAAAPHSRVRPRDRR